MSVYHQMGHDSVNLLNLPELNAYAGAILSPVNYNETKIQSQMRTAEDLHLEMIFDSQLYYPRTERRILRQWSYFPEDVETADLTLEPWWHNLAHRILETCERLNIYNICSPAPTPNAYSRDYYSLMVRVGNYMAGLDETRSIIQTVIINLADLTIPTRAYEIASIVSGTINQRIYLIFLSDRKPRMELTEVEELKGAMKIISLLEQNGNRLIVGYCSSDMMLWKEAGASECATGKYFNLRRFTNRFDETEGGGGQLPYLFSEALIAFIREGDILRLQEVGLLEHTDNPFRVTLMQQIENDQAWLATSWRYYMYAFADLETRINNGTIIVEDALRQAGENWATLDQRNIFMEERSNDGAWIRCWLRAIEQYENI